MSSRRDFASRSSPTPYEEIPPNDNTSGGDCHLDRRRNFSSPGATDSYTAGGPADPLRRTPVRLSDHAAPPLPTRGKRRGRGEGRTSRGGPPRVFLQSGAAGRVRLLGGGGGEGAVRPLGGESSRCCDRKVRLLGGGRGDDLCCDIISHESSSNDDHAGNCVLLYVKRKRAAPDVPWAPVRRREDSVLGIPFAPPPRELGGRRRGRRRRRWIGAWGATRRWREAATRRWRGAATRRWSRGVSPETAGAARSRRVGGSAAAGSLPQFRGENRS